MCVCVLVGKSGEWQARSGEQTKPNQMCNCCGQCCCLSCRFDGKCQSADEEQPNDKCQPAGDSIIRRVTLFESTNLHKIASEH